ncbi:hypothetical protein QUF64_03165 [Anaerolineales bacterium HSG6]|nr:hypothetical protein [Anaerolineales bacterium HSG6]MDM8531096.1 hypothetical protein [Anaerolineales bacterium HSG25]
MKRKRRDSTQLKALCSTTRSIVSQVKSGETVEESRVFLVNQGQPVAVVQDYNTYQSLMNRLESTERELQIVETRERLRQINDGAMGGVPLSQVVMQNFSPIIGDTHVQR